MKFPTLKNKFKLNVDQTLISFDTKNAKDFDISPIFYCLEFNDFDKLNITTEQLDFLIQKSDIKQPDKTKANYLMILALNNKSSKLDYPLNKFLGLIEKNKNEILHQDCFKNNLLMFLVDFNGFNLSAKDYLNIIELNLEQLKQEDDQKLKFFNHLLENKEAYNLFSFQDLNYIFEHSDYQEVDLEIKKLKQFNIHITDHYLNFLEKRKIYLEKKNLNNQINNEFVIKNKNYYKI